MSNPSYAEFIKNPAVKGVSVGTCVGATAKETRVAELADVHAHAHNDPGSKYFGWICVQRIQDLGSKDHVSRTLMHELAHLLSPRRLHHDDRWRARMHGLGQPIPKQFQKRVRHVVAH